MKKTVMILSLFAFLAVGYGQQTETTSTPTITLENFLGIWKTEYIHNPEDPTDDLINHSFELFLSEDHTKENALKGWHCAVIRGGRQIDCDDYNEEAPVHGYLKNDTVYLHFVNNWDDEVEAKLYFDKSARNLSSIIWELGRYEPKLRHFFSEKDTLQKVIGKIPK